MANSTLHGGAYIASLINDAPAEKRGALIEAVNGFKSDTDSREAEIRSAIGSSTSAIDRETAASNAAALSAARSAGAALAYGGEVGPLNGSGAAWEGLMPSRAELRTLVAEGTPADGGYLVPSDTNNVLRDKLRAKSVFLSSGPRIVSMSHSTLVLPTLQTSSGAGVVAERAQIPQATAVFSGPTLKAVKHAALISASNEVLQDSAMDLRQGIAEFLTKDVADGIDTALFSSTANAGQIAGLLSAGNATHTTLATGSTKVTWDSVVDALGLIEAANAMGANLCIFASPLAAKNLRKERAGTTGQYLAGGVTDGNFTDVAFGSAFRVSAKVPAGDVVIASMDYVTVGLRNAVTVKVSEDFYYDTDQVGFRITTRVAGVQVQDANAVVWVTPSAT